MGKFKCLLLVLAGTVVFAVGVPALGLAGAPVINEHFNFASGPFDDEWCGIEGSSVDRVVAHYSEDASGASILNLSVTTLFTATASGKSMEIRESGVRKQSAPVDNGDGTVSFVLANSGPGPMFKIPNGPPIVLDVGHVEFRLTFDAITGDFISFEVLRESGQFPPGCDLIVAALT